MRNDVFDVPIATEATIVDYADDIAVIVVAKDLADVELYSSKAITVIKKWLKDVGLPLAEDKTEAVLITKRRKETTARIRISSLQSRLWNTLE